MKKFLLMAAAALTSMAMSAQLYVTGVNVDGAPAAWNASAPLEVALQDGYYTFKATGNFKISTVKGTWDQFDANCKMLDGAWQRGTTTASAKLKAGAENITAPKPTILITYKVNSALDKIEATAPAGEYFNDVPEPDFYLIGDFNGWGEADASQKFTNNGGGKYTITTTKAISGGWKINNGTWDLNFGQGEAGQPVAGTLYNLATNPAQGNLTTPVPVGTLITLNYVEGGQCTLLIAGGGDDPNPPTPTDFTGWYVNVLGDFNDWKDNGIQPNADGEVTHKDLAIGTSGWKIKIWDGTSDIYLSTGAPVAVGEWVAISGNADANMTVAGAEESSVYNLEFNCKTNSVRLTLVGGDDPNPPTPDTIELVLSGSMNTWAQNDANYLMSRNGYIYTITLPKLEAGTEFKVKEAVNNWTNSWGGSDGGNTVASGEELDAWYDSSVNFLVADEMTDVTVTFVWSGSLAKDVKSTLVVTGRTSAIEAVETAANNAEAVYYNLQGIRVNNPVDGQIYIVNRGGKVSKEIR